MERRLVQAADGREEELHLALAVLVLNGAEKRVDWPVVAVELSGEVDVLDVLRLALVDDVSFLGLEELVGVHLLAQLEAPGGEQSCTG